MNIDDGMIISLDMASMIVGYYINILAVLEMILLKSGSVNTEY